MSPSVAVAAPNPDGLPGPAAEQRVAPPTEPSAVPADQRGKALGKDWQKSNDRLWTTTGDADGLHVMVAEAKTGYTWRTVATLNQPSVDTDRWIGNACVTGSGKRAVVVYAPRTFTNKHDLARRGGFTAVVDLESGAVTKLKIRTSLAYFNPGCGVDEQVALTQEGDEDLGRTGLLRLDTNTAAVGKRVEVPGQLTSAVPVPGGFAAAAISGVVTVNEAGTIKRLATTKNVPARLTPTADGKIAFAEVDNATTAIKQTAAVGQAITTGPAPAATVLATGRTGELSVRHGAAGKAFITGSAASLAALPTGVTAVNAPADAEVSTLGESAVTQIENAAVSQQTARDLAAPRPVHIAAKSLRTGAQLGFTVDPADRVAPRQQDLTDPGATCAVKRNDAMRPVLQPKPKQVEWAADMAVNGELLIERPANWHRNGIGAYRPQVMFPPVALTGGGKVPAQVLLGILGQESNLWQASRYTMPGDYGNPLIGNFYGVDIYNETPADDWTIRWDKADCGYGVGQVTDGMRTPAASPANSPARPANHQIAIATDYAANVAAGLQILATKWNQIQAAGMQLNNNNPAKLENWFLAIWAYNSGYHPPGETGANGAAGLGWLNNPANPRYAIDRQPFGSNPHDFATPQRWPYPEKVLGFAANPPSGFEAPGVEVPFFRAAWWNGTTGSATTPGSANYNRARVKPPVYTFCSASLNNCDPANPVTPNAPEVVGEPTGPCRHVNAAGQYDLKCWWHSSQIWKEDCNYTCGNQFIRYDSSYANAEPQDGVSHPPACGATGLPVDALVVDNRPREESSLRDPMCKRPNFADGTFKVDFKKDAAGQDPGKIDLHQSSSGYGGHYWFTHTKEYNDTSLQATATWTLGRTLSSRAEVKVFIPAWVRSGSNRQTVAYTVHSADGNQHAWVDVTSLSADTWVSLGVYKFNGQPSVSLTTSNGVDNEPSRRIVFDAVAFMPSAEPWPDEIKVRIVHDSTQHCLAVRNGATFDGAYTEHRSCTGSFEEIWGMRAVRQRTEVLNGAPYSVFDYTYRNQNSGKCLAIKDGDTQSGAVAVQDNCDQIDNRQLWKVYSSSPLVGGETYGLKNFKSNLFLGTFQCAEASGLTPAQLAWPDGSPYNCPNPNDPNDVHDTRFWKTAVIQ
ncbi:RICIN domain-containing protein [Alloactinosynnema sp. L-07]|uniref:golvesin C-terminal-like domain-containing protein n=1 Tax=Alloactinosynnema sp. L-07 TaxID=1653480 RepID=UPI0009ED0ABE|nr:RICIN domain-containing protein [Alloactinosynnema sp. L-07]